MAESNFPRSVWVSYASADHDFVQSLTEHFEQCIAIKAVRLMTYMRDETTSEPLTESATNISTKTEMFLKPGESVLDLVEIIASNLRRLLVISPNYLKSEHCLWEMASCFTRESKVPLCILKDLVSFSAVKQSRAYSFMGDDNQHSLAEALAFVYQKRVINMHADFHLLLDSRQQHIDFFAQKLELLSDRNYLVEHKLSSNQLTESILNYVGSFTTEQIINNFETFYKKLYEDWIKKDYAKLCVDSPLVIELGQGERQDQVFELSHLTEQDQDQLTHIVDQLTDNLKPESQNVVEHQNVIREFSTLLALRMVDLTWAAEMRMSSISGVRVRLSVADDEPSRKMFDSQLAASVIQQVPVKMKPNGFEAPIVEGLLNLKPLQGTPEQRKAMQASEQETLLLELIMRVKGIGISKAKQYKARANWQKTLRATIYSRKRDKKTSLLTVARLYIDHQQFQQNIGQRWDELANALVSVLNHQAEENRRVRIGTLVVTSRDEGNLVELVDDHDLLFDHIQLLMEHC